MYWDIILKGFADTSYMVLISVVVAHLIGLPLGVILVVTSKVHIKENAPINKILGTIVNITRSIPFIILLFAMVPITRAIVGTSIGTTAATIPLIVASIPFVGRMVETSLKEIPWGIIEAALAMGASPWQIITKVLLPEAMPSLVLGATITTITLIGYSAMAGVVGGGGLGDIAIRYGYYRYDTEVMLITVLILVAMVQVIQSLGDFIANKIDKR